MRDLFSELAGSIGRNKLRTGLTGFSVAWGIFMIIVLLGAGNGLINAIDRNSGDFATNTMMVGGGMTSMPYDGLKAGRRINLEEKDIDLTSSSLFSTNIDEVTATITTDVSAIKGDRHISGYLEGCFPAKAKMDRIKVLHGRFLNRKDLEERRKVIVITDKSAEKLLDSGAELKSLMGQFIRIDNFEFKVVGITKSENMNSDNEIFTPYSTLKTIFKKGNYMDNITFSFHGLETEEDNEEFEKRYTAAINGNHRAAPEDNSAIWIWNRFTQNMQMNRAGSIIEIALWVVGIFTLLSGIVGVSNIMLITVKERTHEFGIRKAIGASSWSITKLIISESVTITAIFGFVGMVLGLGACELMDRTIGGRSVEIFGEEIPMLVNPTVGMDVALEAILLLIVAGTAAGLIPARKALKVRPIEALRAE